jgi:hypothetical protein
MIQKRCALINVQLTRRITYLQIKSHDLKRYGKKKIGHFCKENIKIKAQKFNLCALIIIYSP